MPPIEQQDAFAADAGSSALIGDRAPNDRAIEPPLPSAATSGSQQAPPVTRAPAAAEADQGGRSTKCPCPSRGAAALAAVIALGAIAAPVAQATSSSVVTIRQSDLIAALGDTRSAGHVTFLTDGLHVMTDDATSQAKAAEYFAVSGPLPTTASLAWFGTNPGPGQQIVFDADGVTGNGNDYNMLVGEPVYGGNWWLTNASSADAKAADPSGANDSGNGSAYFGTLAEWGAALPNARMYAGGFSLGSGVKGDGVIDSITYDGTTYRFTSVASTTTAVRNVHGTSSILRRPHGVRIDLRSESQPANTTLGRKLHWVVKVDGRVALNIREGFGAHDVLRVHFAAGSGKHRIQISKNGVLVRNRVVRF